MIRLLADENIPLDTVAILREAGYDITAVAEDAPRALDVEVLRMARDSERVLLTLDRDFGELIYRDVAPVPPGVVYLRIPKPSPSSVTAALLSFLAAPGIVVLGRFSVVTTDTVRQRVLGR